LDQRLAGVLAGRDAHRRYGERTRILHRDGFAVLDVATRISRDLKRLGDQYVNPPARWS
jgi:hypothetical protein